MSPRRRYRPWDRLRVVLYYNPPVFHLFQVVVEQLYRRGYCIYIFYTPVENYRFMFNSFITFSRETVGATIFSLIPARDPIIQWHCPCKYRAQYTSHDIGWPYLANRNKAFPYKTQLTLNDIRATFPKFRRFFLPSTNGWEAGEQCFSIGPYYR